LVRLLVARVLDEDAPHRLRRRREEMPPAVPLLRPLLIDETQVRLVNQRRRLECLSRLLLRQPRRRQLAQLVIDQRQQLLRRRRVALLDGRQNPRHVTHRPSPHGPSPISTSSANAPSTYPDPSPMIGPWSSPTMSSGGT